MHLLCSYFSEIAATCATDMQHMVYFVCFLLYSNFQKDRIIKGIMTSNHLAYSHLIFSKLGDLYYHLPCMSTTVYPPQPGDFAIWWNKALFG